jgi:hypothetical protein
VYPVGEGGIVFPEKLPTVTIPIAQKPTRVTRTILRGDCRVNLRTCDKRNLQRARVASNAEPRIEKAEETKKSKAKTPNKSCAPLSDKKPPETNEPEKRDRWRPKQIVPVANTFPKVVRTNQRIRDCVAESPCKSKGGGIFPNQPNGTKASSAKGKSFARVACKSMAQLPTLKLRKA